MMPPTPSADIQLARLLFCFIREQGMEERKQVVYQLLNCLQTNPQNWSVSDVQQLVFTWKRENKDTTMPT